MTRLGRCWALRTRRRPSLCLNAGRTVEGLESIQDVVAVSAATTDTVGDASLGIFATHFNDAFAIHSDGGVARWSIRAPLWCEEEGGRSDLELFLSASSSAGAVSGDFNDVRVA